MHISQPIVPALEEIRELLVIETQQVQQRGVEVVDVDFVLHRFVTEISSVSSSIPRCLRSASSAATALSIT